MQLVDLAYEIVDLLSSALRIRIVPLQRLQEIAQEVFTLRNRLGRHGIETLASLFVKHERRVQSPHPVGAIVDAGFGLAGGALEVFTSVPRRRDVGGKAPQTRSLLGVRR